MIQLLFLLCAFGALFLCSKRIGSKRDKKMIQNGWVKKSGFDEKGERYYWERPRPKLPKPTNAPPKQKK